MSCRCRIGSPMASNSQDASAASQAALENPVELHLACSEGGAVTRVRVKGMTTMRRVSIPHCVPATVVACTFKVTCARCQLCDASFPMPALRCQHCDNAQSDSTNRSEREARVIAGVDKLRQVAQQVRDNGGCSQQERTQREAVHALDCQWARAQDREHSARQFSAAAAHNSAQHDAKHAQNQRDLRLQQHDRHLRNAQVGLLHSRCEERGSPCGRGSRHA